MANFEFDTLTLGEVAAIEDLSGVPIATYDEQTPQGKFLAALVMVAKRRNGEPGFKFNDALALPMAEAHAYLGLGEPAPAGPEIPDGMIEPAPALDQADAGKGEPYDESVTG